MLQNRLTKLMELFCFKMCFYFLSLKLSFKWKIFSLFLINFNAKISLYLTKLDLNWQYYSISAVIYLLLISNLRLFDKILVSNLQFKVK